MNKQYEAYYSLSWAWVWVFLATIFAIGIALFSVLWLGSISIILIIAFSVCVLVFLLMFIKTKNQTGIAVEIVDEILILHKKETVSIPLNEIKRIDIHDADGSFDIIIKTASKKYSMHCFIKEQRKKKAILIDLLKSKGINVSTYDLL